MPWHYRAEGARPLHGRKINEGSCVVGPKEDERKGTIVVASVLSEAPSESTASCEQLL